MPVSFRSAELAMLSVRRLRCEEGIVGGRTAVAFVPEELAATLTRKQTDKQSEEAADNLHSGESEEIHARNRVNEKVIVEMGHEKRLATIAELEISPAMQ